MTLGKTLPALALLVALPRLAAAQVPPQVPVNDPYAPVAAPGPGPSDGTVPFTAPPLAPYYTPTPFSQPPPPAYVQQAAPASATPHHHGFTIGAAMGPGEFDYAPSYASATSHGGLSLSLRAGLFVTQRLAIIGDIEGMTFSAPDNANSAVLSDAVTIAAQYYVNSKVWIKGGLGIGHVSASEPTSACNGCSKRQDSGSAAIAGLGYEAWQRPHFAVSIELSGGASEIQANDSTGKASVTHIGLLVGLQWF